MTVPIPIFAVLPSRTECINNILNQIIYLLFGPRIQLGPSKQLAAATFPEAHGLSLTAIELRVITTSSDALGSHMTYIIAQWFPLVEVTQLRAQNELGKGSVMHGNTVNRRTG
jgi:hypothetical protein